MADKGFSSKQARKKYRKGLIQGALKNKVADVRVGARQRADFYAQLRHMKLRRHEIAKEFQHLGTAVEDLQRDVRKLADRQGVNRSGVDECVAALLKVRSNVTTVTDDYRSLAHKKIFYGEKAA